MSLRDRTSARSFTPRNTQGHDRSLGRAIAIYLNDDSAQVLPEYAIVLVTVTMASIFAFGTIAKSGSTLIQKNANGITNMNLANYQSS